MASQGDGHKNPKLSQVPYTGQEAVRKIFENFSQMSASLSRFSVQLDAIQESAKTIGIEFSHLAFIMHSARSHFSKPSGSSSPHRMDRQSDHDHFNQFAFRELGKIRIKQQIAKETGTSDSTKDDAQRLKDHEQFLRDKAEMTKNYYEKIKTAKTTAGTAEFAEEEKRRAEDKASHEKYLADKTKLTQDYHNAVKAKKATPGTPENTAEQARLKDEEKDHLAYLVKKAEMTKAYYEKIKTAKNTIGTTENTAEQSRLKDEEKDHLAYLVKKAAMTKDYYEKIKTAKNTIGTVENAEEQKHRNEDNKAHLEYLAQKSKLTKEYHENIKLKKSTPGTPENDSEKDRLKDEEKSQLEYLANKAEISKNYYEKIKNAKKTVGTAEFAEEEARRAEDKVAHEKYLTDKSQLTKEYHASVKLKKATPGTPENTSEKARIAEGEKAHLEYLNKKAADTQKYYADAKAAKAASLLDPTSDASKTAASDQAASLALYTAWLQKKKQHSEEFYAGETARKKKESLVIDLGTGNTKQENDDLEKIAPYLAFLQLKVNKAKTFYDLQKKARELQTKTERDERRAKQAPLAKPYQDRKNAAKDAGDTHTMIDEFGEDRIAPYVDFLFAKEEELSAHLRRMQGIKKGGFAEDVKHTGAGIKKDNDDSDWKPRERMAEKEREALGDTLGVSASYSQPLQEYMSYLGLKESVLSAHLTAMESIRNKAKTPEQLERIEQKKKTKEENKIKDADPNYKKSDDKDRIEEEKSYYVKFIEDLQTFYDKKYSVTMLGEERMDGLWSSIKSKRKSGKKDVDAIINPDPKNPLAPEDNKVGKKKKGSKKDKQEFTEAVKQSDISEKYIIVVDTETASKSGTKVGTDEYFRSAEIIQVAASVIDKATGNVVKSLNIFVDKPDTHSLAENDKFDNLRNAYNAAPKVSKDEAATILSSFLDEFEGKEGGMVGVAKSSFDQKLGKNAGHEDETDPLKNQLKRILPSTEQERNDSSVTKTVDLASLLKQLITFQKKANVLLGKDPHSEIQDALNEVHAKRLDDAEFPEDANVARANAAKDKRNDYEGKTDFTIEVLAEHFGVESVAHDASGDVAAEGLVFLKILEQMQALPESLDTRGPKTKAEDNAKIDSNVGALAEFMKGIRENIGGIKSQSTQNFKERVSGDDIFVSAMSVLESILAPLVGSFAKFKPEDVKDYYPNSIEARNKDAIEEGQEENFEDNVSSLIDSLGKQLGISIPKLFKVISIHAGESIEGTGKNKGASYSGAVHRIKEKGSDQFSQGLELAVPPSAFEKGNEAQLAQVRASLLEEVLHGLLNKTGSPVSLEGGQKELLQAIVTSGEGVDDNAFSDTTTDSNGKKVKKGYLSDPQELIMAAVIKMFSGANIPDLIKAKAPKDKNVQFALSTINVTKPLQAFITRAFKSLKVPVISAAVLGSLMVGMAGGAESKPLESHIQDSRVEAQVEKDRVRDVIEKQEEEREVAGLPPRVEPQSKPISTPAQVEAAKKAAAAKHSAQIQAVRNQQQQAAALAAFNAPSMPLTDTQAPAGGLGGGAAANQSGSVVFGNTPTTPPPNVNKNVALADLPFALVDSVTDGDTVKLTIKFADGSTQQLSLRMYGYDAPESKGDKWQEQPGAKAAKAALAKLLTNKKLKLKLKGVSHNRRVGDLIDADSGQSISQQMVAEGHGMPYMVEPQDEAAFAAARNQAAKDKKGLHGQKGAEPIAPETWRSPRLSPEFRQHHIEQFNAANGIVPTPEVVPPPIQIVPPVVPIVPPEIPAEVPPIVPVVPPVVPIVPPVVPDIPVVAPSAVPPVVPPSAGPTEGGNSSIPFLAKLIASIFALSASGAALAGFYDVGGTKKQDKIKEKIELANKKLNRLRKDFNELLSIKKIKVGNKEDTTQVSGLILTTLDDMIKEATSKLGLEKELQANIDGSDTSPGIKTASTYLNSLIQRKEKTLNSINTPVVNPTATPKPKKKPAATTPAAKPAAASGPKPVSPLAFSFPTSTSSIVPPEAPAASGTGSGSSPQAISVTCGACGATYKLPISAAGKKVKCPRCSAAIEASTGKPVTPATPASTAGSSPVNPAAAGSTAGPVPTAGATTEPVVGTPPIVTAGSTPVTAPVNTAEPDFATKRIDSKLLESSTDDELVALLDGIKKYASEILKNGKATANPLFLKLARANGNLIIAQLNETRRAAKAASAAAAASASATKADADKEPEVTKDATTKDAAKTKEASAEDKDKFEIKNPTAPATDKFKEQIPLTLGEAIAETWNRLSGQAYKEPVQEDAKEPGDEKGFFQKHVEGVTTKKVEKAHDDAKDAEGFSKNVNVKDEEDLILFGKALTKADDSVNTAIDSITNHIGIFGDSLDPEELELWNKELQDLEIKAQLLRDALVATAKALEKFAVAVDSDDDEEETPVPQRGVPNKGSTPPPKKKPAPVNPASTGAPASPTANPAPKGGSKPTPRYGHDSSVKGSGILGDDEAFDYAADEAQAQVNRSQAWDDENHAIKLEEVEAELAGGSAPTKNPTKIGDDAEEIPDEYIEQNAIEEPEEVAAENIANDDYELDSDNYETINADDSSDLDSPVFSTSSATPTTSKPSSTSVSKPPVVNAPEEIATPELSDPDFSEALEDENDQGPQEGLEMGSEWDLNTNDFEENPFELDFDDYDVNKDDKRVEDEAAAQKEVEANYTPNQKKFWEDIAKEKEEEEERAGLSSGLSTGDRTKEWLRNKLINQLLGERIRDGLEGEDAEDRKDEIRERLSKQYDVLDDNYDLASSPPLELDKDLDKPKDSLDIYKSMGGTIGYASDGTSVEKPSIFGGIFNSIFGKAKPKKKWKPPTNYHPTKNNWDTDTNFENKYRSGGGDIEKKGFFGNIFDNIFGEAKPKKKWKPKPNKEMVKNNWNTDDTFENSYRALGGDVSNKKDNSKSLSDLIFKPRGSDTVPAMTPEGQPYMLEKGERVIKRSESEKNKDLLDNINDGKIKKPPVYAASGTTAGGSKGGSSKGGSSGSSKGGSSKGGSGGGTPPPATRPTSMGSSSGDPLAPLGAWVKDFIANSRVGVIGGSFMALGKAVQGAMYSLGNFVKGASPDTFSTLQGSIALLTGSIGIGLIPVFLRASSIIQGWAKDIQNGTGVMGGLVTGVTKFIDSIDQGTLEFLVGVGLFVAGLTMFAPVLGIVIPIITGLAAGFSLLSMPLVAFGVLVVAILDKAGLLGPALNMLVSGVSFVVSALATGVGIIVSVVGTLLGAVTSFVGFFVGIGASIGGYILGLFSPLAPFFNMLGQVLFGLVGVIGAAIGIWAMFGGTVMAVIGFFSGLVGSVVALFGAVAGFFTTVGSLSGLFTLLYTWCAGLVTSFAAAVASTWTYVANMAKAAIAVIAANPMLAAFALALGAGIVAIGLWEKAAIKAAEAKSQGDKNSRETSTEKKYAEGIADTGGKTKEGRVNALETEAAKQRKVALKSKNDANDLEYGKNGVKMDKKAAKSMREGTVQEEGRKLNALENQLLVEQDPNQAKVRNQAVTDRDNGVTAEQASARDNPKGIDTGLGFKLPPMPDFKDLKLPKFDFKLPKFELPGQKKKTPEEEAEAAKKKKADDIASAKQGVAASMGSMKSQSSFSSVEEAYKKIQVSALGDDPMTVELKKIQEQSLARMLIELQKLNGTNKVIAEKKPEGVGA